MACYCRKCGLTKNVVGRERMDNSAKRKLIDVPHVRPEEPLVKRMRAKAAEKVMKTETPVKVSLTVTRRVSKENPLKGKRGDVPQDPRPVVTAEKKKQTEREIFYNRYAVGHLLGKGGNGSVFAGVRRSDGKKVALKFVRKSVNDKYITVPGGTRRLPVEVALMELVCKPPHFPFVIELLEWFETPVGFIIVLERPYPCVDLYKFCRHVALSEAMAKIIMQQVIQAALHCRERGVFHRDIKEENILINTQTLEVKPIDFGCGDLHKDTPYNEYCGTPICYPPEWISSRMCEAESATVWTLGVLLYSMLCGHKPFFRLGDIVHRQQLFPTYLSKSACSLISWCLQKDPKRRPTLEQMLAHNWL